MEYVVPAVLFVLGFGGALLMRRVVSMWTRRGRSRDLPVQKGAVRLDTVGKKRRRKK